MEDLAALSLEELRARLAAPPATGPAEASVAARLSRGSGIAAFELERNELERNGLVAALSRRRGSANAASRYRMLRTGSVHAYSLIYAGMEPRSEYLGHYYHDLSSFDALCKREAANRALLINEIRSRLVHRLFERYPTPARKQNFWQALARYLELRCGYLWHGEGREETLRVEVPDFQWAQWQDDFIQTGRGTKRLPAHSAWPARDRARDKRALEKLELEHPMLLLVPALYAEPHKAALSCFITQKMDGTRFAVAAERLHTQLRKAVISKLQDTANLYKRLDNSAAAHSMAWPLYLTTAQQLLVRHGPVGPVPPGEHLPIVKHAFECYAPMDPMALAGSIMTAMAVTVTAAALLAGPLGLASATTGFAVLGLLVDTAALVVDFHLLQNSLTLAEASRGERVLRLIDPALTLYETDRSAFWEISLFTLSVLSLGMASGQLAKEFAGFGANAMKKTVARGTDTRDRLTPPTAAAENAAVAPVKPPRKQVKDSVEASEPRGETSKTGKAEDGTREAVPPRDRLTTISEDLAKSVDGTAPAERFLANKDFRKFLDEGGLETSPLSVIKRQYDNLVKGRGYTTKGNYYYRLYHEFKKLVGRDEAYKQLRRERGYLDKLLDKKELHRYWESEGLARQVDDPPRAKKKWEYLVNVEGNWVWKPRNEIDFGHIIDCVVFDRLVFSIETHLLEVAARTGRDADWYSYRLYKLRKLFMGNVRNYVPELSKTNREQGTVIKEGYAANKTFPQSLTNIVHVKDWSALPKWVPSPLEVLDELLPRMANEIDLPELAHVADDVKRALAGDQKAAEQLLEFAPASPQGLSPYLDDTERFLLDRGIDPENTLVSEELIDELYEISGKDAVNQWHRR